MKKDVRWARGYSQSQSRELSEQGWPSPGWGPWRHHPHGHLARSLGNNASLCLLLPSPAWPVLEASGVFFDMLLPRRFDFLDFSATLVW